MRRFNVLTIIAMTAIVLMSCKKGDTETEQTIQELQAIHGIPVKVEVAQKGVVRHVEKVSGTAEGINQSYLSNPQGGTLQRIAVRTGQRVSEGDIIAVMFFEDGSPRSVAQASYDHASRMYERVQLLREEGAATQEQVEGARVQYENARRGLRGASVAEFVRAPFDGVILEVFETEGTKIDGRTQIASMADFSRIRIDAMVSQLNINRYQVGQDAFVFANGMDSDTLWGKVTNVAAGGSVHSHTFRVGFEFPNQENKLMVGMFKEIFVVIKENAEAISVPVDVVTYVGQNPAVFVIVESEGENELPIAVLREVELGINSGSDLEIISGIQEGERFVVTGASLLSDSVKVNIVGVE
jgi:RND family efflux transporter MFP subunit